MTPNRFVLPAFTASLILLAACKPAVDDAATPSAQVTPAAEAADLVIRDARVYTLNPRRPWAEAVAVRDGVIIAVGSADDMSALTGPETRILSQPGGMVLPGFQDAHVHPYTSGLDHFDCSLDILPLIPSEWDGKPLRELVQVEKKAGRTSTALDSPSPHGLEIQVAALTRAGRAVLPDLQAVLMAGDLLLVSATFDGISIIRQRLESSQGQEV